MRLPISALTVMVAAARAIAASLQGSSSPALPITVKSEFLFEKAPFDSVHASTIVRTKEGLITAWFAGTREGAPDVGIWTARETSGTWSEPKEVATGIQPDG